MNKSKRMAMLKQRRRKKKLEERRKAIAMTTGLGITATKPVAEQVIEVVQPEAPPKPKKAGRKPKVKAEAASTEAKATVPEVETAQPEIPPEGRQKKQD